jgi:hypothetical protein
MKPDSFLPLHNNWFHILLSLAGNEQHGYGIMQEVLERTNGGVRIWPATLYGALQRMIAGGLIEESEERPAHPRRGNELHRGWPCPRLPARIVEVEAGSHNVLTVHSRRIPHESVARHHGDAARAGRPRGSGSRKARTRILHPDLTVLRARTLEEDVNDWSSFVEWQSTIFVILDVFALLLACIGLGGVTAYAVERRRKEIGIRMALGARGSQVQGLVLREGAALVTVGSMLGFGGAFVLWRLLTAYSEMLARTFDRPVSGPLLMAGAPLTLASLTMLACYLPARRATRIEPIAAVRQE